MRIIKCTAISHVGNSRNNNEDNFFLPTTDGKHFSFNRGAEKIFASHGPLPNDFCCAVSDGMGGHAFGEVASLKTVNYLSEIYNNLINNSDNKNTIVNYITKLNNDFCNLAMQNQDYRTMGATLCGVIVHNTTALCFNVGDSRLYTCTSGKLKQITKDHSEGQRLFDLQLLTADELKTFPNRKAIYKYIGQKTNLIPDLFKIENIYDCSYLLLCTDGLTDVLSDVEIEEVLNTLDMNMDQKCEKMLQMALNRNLNIGDNITIMLIGFKER